MAIRQGGARAAKGNGLNGEKSGAFGAMMTFRRSAVGQRSCATSGKARRGVEKEQSYNGDPLKGVCPSGQRERAVNPSAQPTEVRILPPPLARSLARARRDRIAVVLVRSPARRRGLRSRTGGARGADELPRGRSPGAR